MASCLSTIPLLRIGSLLAPNLVILLFFRIVNKSPSVDRVRWVLPKIHFSPQYYHIVLSVLVDVFSWWEMRLIHVIGLNHLLKVCISVFWVIYKISYPALFLVLYLTHYMNVSDHLKMIHLEEVRARLLSSDLGLPVRILGNHQGKRNWEYRSHIQSRLDIYFSSHGIC